ncbi:unannotated protein [freshwater metagenome]|uniref:Unannotated protein n=1 Tax=freshwater metagenome TaxID=449393 RepID=A0A6J6WYB9_9ZZZZ
MTLTPLRDVPAALADDDVAADPTTARAIAAAIATTLWLFTCIFYPSLGIKSLEVEGVLQQRALTNPL